VVAPLVSGFLRDMTGSLIPAILTASLLMFFGAAMLLLTPDAARASAE
jgi:hypothetical protein